MWWVLDGLILWQQLHVEHVDKLLYIMKTRLFILCGAMFIVVRILAQSFDFAALDSSYVTCTTGSYYAPYFKEGVVPGQHTVITEQGFDSVVPSLQLIPPGSTRSVRLGNPSVGAEGEAIIYDVLVTKANAILVLNYAAVMQNPDHISTRQPRFTLDILDSNGFDLDCQCGGFDFVANSGLGWMGEDPMWKDWTTIGLDLSDYIGSRIRIRLTNRDCAEKGHYGYAYFTLDFMSRDITSDQCGNVDTNTYVAPAGFNYRWTTAQDTTNVLSTDQALEVPMDFTEYICKMSQIGKEYCNFSLRFIAEPRYPVAKFVSKISRGYVDTLYLKNSSFISRDGINPKAIHESVDSAVWDLGDGRILPATDSVLPVVYARDGRYTVTLRTYLKGGKCFDEYQQSFYVVGLEKHIYLNKSICRGDYYNFNGRYINEAGHYVDTLYNGQCTEVYNLNLSVNQVYRFIEHAFLCKGDSYNFRGQTLTKSGIYADTLISSTGCDSIHEVILNFVPAYIIESEVTICDVESYYFRGKKLRYEGIYYDTLFTDHGCDSIYRLKLNVLPTYRIDTTYTKICINDTVYFGSQVITQSGIYYDTISTDNNHCGLRILVLEVVHPTSIVEASVDEVCADDGIYLVNYNYRGPEPISYSLYYDNKAKSQGFVDVIDRPYDGFIYDSLPHSFETAYQYVRPDEYTVVIEIKNDICNDTLYRYTMPLMIRYPSWVLEQKWNDVVALLNEDKNGGYRFSAYEWSRNGDIVPRANNSYLYLPDDMQPGDHIVAHLTREGEDYSVPTCGITIVNNSDKQKSNMPVLITFDDKKHIRVKTEQSGHYYIYTLSGQLIDSDICFDGETILPVDSVSRGLYFVRVELSDGSIHTQSVIL